MNGGRSVGIRVLLADDHMIMRQGLRTLLENENDLDVVGEAEDGRQAVQKARELVPDVVIMDAAMPGLNGMEATRRILDELNSVRIVALSMHSDKRFVGEMLRAGASGYLLKESAFEELALAIRAVAKGQIYLSPAVAGSVVEGYVSSPRRTRHPAGSALTAREREVLQLLAEGQTTKHIAARLGLSPKTVSTHRANIMAKLEVASVAELTKYAVREGLTSL